MNLTNFVKSKSLEFGFTHVGISSAEVEEFEKEKLKSWLNKKYDASMKWIGNNFEKRVNPKLVLENTQSVISLSVNYFTDFKHESSGGKISRYAWGSDYHEVLEAKIKLLINCIKEIDTNGEYKYYVDTGPILEKYFAQKSGIGWRGKHSNLISKDFGSWIFLATILTSTKLESDLPHEDFCGNCTACIDACPTNAIVQPYVVDSNKCISYLTIEHRGEIENEIGKKFNNWIFGCDICQDVCPWNRFETMSDVKVFSPINNQTNLNLEEITNLTQNDFSTRFKNSPIKRIKLIGIKRNAELIKKN